LQRNGTLPTVWVPPGGLRDLRELTRTRMVLVSQRTRLKNRITSALAKYGLQLVGASDPYGKRRRQQLEFRLARLPEQTRAMNALLLEQLDSLDVHIDATERRIRRLVEQTPEMLLLKTLPGIGNIQRIRRRRGHAKAIGAVARHLAEATYHVWTRQEPYRDPALKKGLSQGGESADAS